MPTMLDDGTPSSYSHNTRRAPYSEEDFAEEFDIESYLGSDLENEDSYSSPGSGYLVAQRCNVIAARKQKVLQERHAAAVAFYSTKQRSKPSNPVVRRKQQVDQENDPKYPRNMSDAVTETGPMRTRQSPRTKKGRNPNVLPTKNNATANRIPRKPTGQSKAAAKPDDSIAVGQISIPAVSGPPLDNAPENPVFAHDSATIGQVSNDTSPSAKSTGSTDSDTTTVTEEAEHPVEDIQPLIGEVPNKVSADQLRAVLEQRKEQWKKEDLQKKKADLLIEIGLAKSNAFTVRANNNILASGKARITQQFHKAKEKCEELHAKNEAFKGDLKLVAAQNKRNEQEIKNLRKENAEAQEIIAQLQQKLRQAKQKHAVKSGRNRCALEENKNLLPVIVDKAKNILWGMVKFIQSPDEEMRAAKLLFRFGDFGEDILPNKEYRLEYAELYSQKIKRAIFDKRNYVSAEIKKYYKKMWAANMITLTVEDLIMCVKRNITTEDDMDKFMTYWEEILPKMVGLWDKNTRYYDRISTAIRNDCTTHDLHLITPEDEAFTVLCIENSVQRWKEECNAKKKAVSGGKQGKPKKSGEEVLGNVSENQGKSGEIQGKSGEVQGKSGEVQGNKKGGTAEEEKKKKNYSGLYTSTTSGQNQYGGWSEEGLELFNEYMEMNIKAREEEKTEQVEKDCLRLLRQKYGIHMNNAEEQNKYTNRMKSAKKRGVAEDKIMPPMKKVVSTIRQIHLSDDEEMENEE